MFFLYNKHTGAISIPLHRGEPSNKALNKEANCELGSGINWDNAELFYAPDEEFIELGGECAFCKWAPLGKYYIDNGEIKETAGWQEPEEEP